MNDSDPQARLADVPARAARHDGGASADTAGVAPDATGRPPSRLTAPDPAGRGVAGFGAWGVPGVR
jgi:hypothetical protein